MKRALNVYSQNLESPRDSGLARGPKSVGIGSSDENAARTQADCFYDIAAAADSAIHQDFDLTVDGRDDFRQRAYGRRNRVQLPATMIRHYDRRRAFVHRAFGVLASQQSLHHDGPGPEFTNPSQVFPLHSGRS